MTQRQQTQEDRTFKRACLAMTVLAFVLAVATATGLVGSDDLHYSRYAQRIAQGDYEPEPNHFAIRFGLLVPVAVLYRLFGVSEWSTFALPLLAATLSVPMLMILGRRLFNSRVAMIAGFLLATFPVHLRFATILVPEPVATLYLLVAMWVWVRFNAERPLASATVFGMLVGVAYLTKEPAVFVGGALILFLAAQRRWMPAAAIVAGLSIVMTGELLYYAAQTGDPLFRFHSMALHNTSPMAVGANEKLPYRLLVAYPRMMLVPDIHSGMHSLATLALVGIGMLVFWKKYEPTHWLLFLWAGVPWLYLNFGTSSFSEYFALPYQARYLLFIYPPLFLLAAVVVDRHMKRRTESELSVYQLASVLVTIGIVGFFCALQTRAEGWRAHQVAALRLICGEADLENWGRIRVEDDSYERRWDALVMILRPHNAAKAEPAVVLRRDDANLPYVSHVELQGGDVEDMPQDSSTPRDHRTTGPNVSWRRVP